MSSGSSLEGIGGGGTKTNPLAGAQALAGLGGVAVEPDLALIDPPAKLRA